MSGAGAAGGTAEPRLGRDPDEWDKTQGFVLDADAESFAIDFLLHRTRTLCREWYAISHT